MRAASVMAALATIALAVPAVACDKDKKLVAEKAPSAAKAGCCKTRSTQVVEKVMQDMPQMTYKVGDYQTGCPDAAQAKAGENGKVQFVVAEETFDSKTAAVVALTEQLENETKNLSKVVFAVGDETFCCPMTAGQTAKAKKTDMRYRVAGVDFDSKEKADKAARLVSAVMSSGAADATTSLAKTKSSGCGKGCGKAAKASAAGAKSSGCRKAATASATKAKSGCCGKSAKAAAASATKAKSGGCGKSAKVAEAKAADPKAEPRLATGEAPFQCCQKAEARLASVQAKIRLMVETAATAL